MKFEARRGFLEYPSDEDELDDDKRAAKKGKQKKD